MLVDLKDKSTGPLHFKACALNHGEMQSGHSKERKFLQSFSIIPNTVLRWCIDLGPFLLFVPTFAPCFQLILSYFVPSNLASIKIPWPTNFICLYIQQFLSAITG